MKESEKLDLAQLEAFYQVARQGSVGEAARLLGRSQPAISHRIRALADALGVTLFEKVGRRLILSPAGSVLYQRSRRLFAEARDLLEQVKAMREGPVGRVKIGTYPTIASHLLIEPLVDWLDPTRALTITLELGLAANVCDRLRIGELDLVISADERDLAGFEVAPLGKERMVAVMAPSIAPRPSGHVTLDELRALRLLSWVGPKDIHFASVQTYAVKHGLYDEMVPIIPSIDTLRALTAREIGYTFLPSYTVRADLEAGRLVALTPEGLDHVIHFYLLSRPQQASWPALDLVRTSILALPFLGVGS